MLAAFAAARGGVSHAELHGAFLHDHGHRVQRDRRGHLAHARTGRHARPRPAPLARGRSSSAATWTRRSTSASYIVDVATPDVGDRRPARRRPHRALLLQRRYAGAFSRRRRAVSRVQRWARRWPTTPTSAGSTFATRPCARSCRIASSPRPARAATASSRAVSLRSRRPPTSTSPAPIRSATIAGSPPWSMARGLSIGLVENDAGAQPGSASPTSTGPCVWTCLDTDCAVAVAVHRRGQAGVSGRIRRRDARAGRLPEGARSRAVGDHQDGTATWTRSASAVPSTRASKSTERLTNIARARATCGERAGSRRPGTRCGDHVRTCNVRWPSRP